MPSLECPANQGFRREMPHGIQSEASALEVLRRSVVGMAQFEVRLSQQ
ncbi:MAG: hypothetical protein ABEI32_09640 [Halothece sp.]